MTMDYKFINNESDRTIVLLHGTGGDENDLIFIGQQIDPKANLLGLRGRINEHGMNRFFRRIKPGVFDIDNLVEETKYLHKFLQTFAKINQLDSSKMVLLGFSNGANIIASLIYHYGKFYQAHILLHPMIPIRNFKVVKQDQNLVFISAGDNDPIVPFSEVQDLVEILENHGAEVEFKVYSFGHSLSEKELIDIQKFYKKKVIKSS